MMNILKSSSSRSDFFTGFCCLLTFFEGASYEEIDSRADYLSKFPKYKIVADCLQKHRKINLIGNHFSKGLEFLKEYKPINYRQAVYAMRIFELIKMVNSKLLQKIAYEDQFFHLASCRPVCFPSWERNIFSWISFIYLSSNKLDATIWNFDFYRSFTVPCLFFDRGRNCGSMESEKDSITHGHIFVCNCPFIRIVT